MRCRRVSTEEEELGAGDEAEKRGGLRSWKNLIGGECSEWEDPDLQEALNESAGRHKSDLGKGYVRSRVILRVSH